MFQIQNHFFVNLQGLKKYVYKFYLNLLGLVSRSCISVCIFFLASIYIYILDNSSILTTYISIYITCLTYVNNYIYICFICYYFIRHNTVGCVGGGGIAARPISSAALGFQAGQRSHYLCDEPCAETSVRIAQDPESPQQGASPLRSQS